MALIAVTPKLSNRSPAARLALLSALAGTLAACGGSPHPREAPAPAPTAPLPTAGLAGQKVVVYPLILLAADERLRWDSVLTPRRNALDHADSMLAEVLTARSPEVTWVLPPALRQVARRTAPVTTSPDQTPTSLLRSPGLKQLPDPLWSQMRNLVAVAGDRYALVPASLIFVPAPGGGGGGGGSGGRAELTLVLADVRSGAVAWRTVANAVAGDPWEGLARALKALTPWLP